MEYSLSWKQPVIVSPKKPPVDVPFLPIHVEDVANAIVNSVATDLDGQSRFQSLIVDEASILVTPGKIFWRNQPKLLFFSRRKEHISLQYTYIKIVCLYLL